MLTGTCATRGQYLEVYTGIYMIIALYGSSNPHNISISHVLQFDNFDRTQIF